MRAVLRFVSPPALALFALVAVAGPGAAQTLDGPVTVFSGSLTPEQLATGRDGAVLAVGAPTYPRIGTHLYAPTRTAAVTLDARGDSPGVTALPHGGFAALWTDQPDGTQDFNERLVAQRLSPAGSPTGPAVPASAFGEDSVGDGGIAPAGDGFVVAFEINFDIVGQRYDGAGAPVGSRFVIEHDDVQAFNTRVVAVPGGFLVAWQRSRDVHARLYASDATPLGAIFTVARMELTGLAVNTAGTLAAVVGVPPADAPNPNELRLRFFTPDGSSLGAEQVVGPRQFDARPDVVGDRSSNFLVVAGPGISARAYDANGAPLGPLVTLDAVGTSGDVKASARREGGFFALRGVGSTTRLARITLCAPGAAVCGDGTLVPTCEICDAGAGNSNAVPDACRTDCVPARCGDGTTDGDEACDDGNALDCDGCSELCELEVGTTCGDGIRGPLACGEACDDGNAITGDGCTDGCKLERILGGGKSVTDCYAAWRIDNPSNDPRFDKRGGVNPKQTCHDDDPACDFDGGVVGSCTFHLAVCANNTGTSGCVAERLQSWEVTGPSEKQALTRPPLAAVRTALASTVVPTIVGAGDANTCSPNADVVVPLRATASGGFKANKLKLKSRATIYGGAVDTDGLQLRCEP